MDPCVADGTVPLFRLLVRSLLFVPKRRWATLPEIRKYPYLLYIADFSSRSLGGTMRGERDTNIWWLEFQEWFSDSSACAPVCRHSPLGRPCARISGILDRLYAWVPSFTVRSRVGHHWSTGMQQRQGSSWRCSHPARLHIHSARCPS